MSERRSTRHLRCPECKIHKDWCFCQHIHSTDLKTKVSFIVHHKERWLPSSTVNLAKRCLTNCDITLRGLKDSAPFNDIDDSYTPLYLYPDEEAFELSSDFLETLKKPVQLIVPDGTWRQAKKIKVREPALQNIQSVMVKSNNPSMYTLRKQKYEYGLCTFEAVAYALELIEGKEISSKLLKMLKIMNHNFECTRNNKMNPY